MYVLLFRHSSNDNADIVLGLGVNHVDLPEPLSTPNIPASMSDPDSGFAHYTNFSRPAQSGLTSVEPSKVLNSPGWPWERPSQFVSVEASEEPAIAHFATEYTREDMRYVGANKYNVSCS
jgi:hypothetical protein